MRRYSRPVALVVGLSVVALLGSGVSAKEESSPTPAQPTTRKASPQDEVMARLDGTSWALDLTPLSGGQKAKPQQDTVSFAKTQVISETLSKTGYPASNYSLTIGDDGVAVWETMQTKEGEGIAFWRGELHGDTMRGVLSKHPEGSEAVDFSFLGKPTGPRKSSASAAGKAPSAKTPPGITQTPAAAPDAAGSAEPPAPKKKKRGWF